MIRWCNVILLSFAVYSQGMVARPVVHHDLQVFLKPEQGWLQVADTIRLPPDGLRQPLCWRLQVGLRPQLVEPRLFLQRAAAADVPLEQFCLQLPAGTTQLRLHYAGPLQSPPSTPEFSEIPPIAAQGVYLDAATYWYPRLGDELLSFQLTVHLPRGWRAITQGTRQRRQETPEGTVETWQETQPQEAIYLLAGPFQEYTGATQPALAQVFLRRPDNALAQRYLQVTPRYLYFYSRLLGNYPYGKFALVENVWDSGYGMPSFTLLGPRVIRLPFIVHTSYPHEILHNWWGNSVYVDYATGNWSEGLTAYLADHLLQEQQGEGAAYRRAALQRYVNYINVQRDFPLTEFRARHGEVTQAVGYDKGLMFFHMLRRQLGDQGFIAGLRQFYQTQQFQRAGFTDLQAAWETAGGTSLAAEFRQWLTRSGAPVLSVSGLQARPVDGGFRVTGQLAQTQPGPAYVLRVPLAVQTEQAQAWQTVVTLTGKRLPLQLTLSSRPWRLAVDPEFDLMRRLDRGEIPPSLSQVFGAERLLIVLPEAATPERKAAYQAIAEGWVLESGAEFRWDGSLAALPPGRGIWLFGWNNRFRPQLAAALQEQPVALTEQRVTLNQRTLPRGTFGVVMVARHPADREQALAWLAWDNGQALPRLARKLRHYGKYSYLAFIGEAAANVLKGQWPVTGSPLNVGISQWDNAKAPPWRATLAPRPALSEVLAD